MSDFINYYHEYLRKQQRDTEAIRKMNEELKESMRQIEAEYRRKNRIARYL